MNLLGALERWRNNYRGNVDGNVMQKAINLEEEIKNQYEINQG